MSGHLGAVLESEPRQKWRQERKSLKMKRYVGMACQKVHKQGRIKRVMQKPCPYIFTLSWKDLGTDKALYIYHHFILACLCTFWHAISTSLFIFNDFSFLFLYFLVVFSAMLWSKQYFYQMQPQPWNGTDSWVIVQVSPSMQPHTGIYIVWSPDLLLLTTQAWLHLAFMSRTFILAFES